MVRREGAPRDAPTVRAATQDAVALSMMNNVKERTLRSAERQDVSFLDKIPCSHRGGFSIRRPELQVLVPVDRLDRHVARLAGVAAQDGERDLDAGVAAAPDRAVELGQRAHRLAGDGL